MKNLRDLGNTVIVVEHDEDTMREADFLVDIGPGAGVHGGQVIFAGPPQEIESCEASLTGQYLSGKRKVEVPEARRKGNGKFLEIRGASQNNLQNVNVKIPLGEFVCVTGVSGSGKSSLINEILYKKLAAELNRAHTHPGKHKEIRGLEHLDKVIQIDQSPIGRTPRSNPATYTGLFNDIRELFASTQDAKMRGFTASRFSFNVKGGRCEACQGDGIICIEMHFLPDVYVPCDVCKGPPLQPGNPGSEVQGQEHLRRAGDDRGGGLGLLPGHPQAGEKAANHLRRGPGLCEGGPARHHPLRRRGPAGEAGHRALQALHGADHLYPGRAHHRLHIADVHRLIDVLQRLVDAGNTVVVIEHNLDLIKTADHIIDLGPEGGNRGGTIVAQGTPEQVAQVAESYTGQYCGPLLGK